MQNFNGAYLQVVQWCRRCIGVLLITLHWRMKHLNLSQGSAVDHSHIPAAWVHFIWCQGFNGNFHPIWWLTGEEEAICVSVSGTSNLVHLVSVVLHKKVNLFSTPKTCLTLYFRRFFSRTNWSWSTPSTKKVRRRKPPQTPHRNRAIGVLGVMDMSQRHPQVVATQIFFIFIPGVSWSNLRVAYFSGLVKNPPTRTSFQLFQASLSLLDYGHLRAGCVACLEPSRNQGAKWEDWHKPTFSQSGTVDGRVPGCIKPYTTNLNWLAVELTGCRIEDLVIWDFDGEGSRWLQGCKRWPLRGNQSICRDPSCSLDFVAILHDDEDVFFL